LITRKVIGPGVVPKRLQPIILPSRPREVKFAFSRTDTAKALLGYETKTSLEEGIRRTVQWAKTMGYQVPRYLDKVELPSKDLPKTWKAKLI